MAADDRPRPLGRAFDALLAASGVSNLGDGIRLAALPLLAAALTDSPRLIAGVTAAQFLPWLLFGPFGGVIVDRADRRRLILVTQAWRALVMGALGAIVLADVAAMWMLFVVAFVITVGEILVDPSVVATVPTLVDGRDLDRANGRISSVEVVTNDLVGAPVGAGLFSVVPGLPFVADGLTYLASVVPFRRLPRLPKPTRSPVDVRSVLGEVPVGARWLLSHPMLRPWTGAVAVFNVGAAAAFSLLVVLVLDALDSGSAGYAIVLTAAAVGAALGSSVAARLVARVGRPPILLIAAALIATTTAMLAGTSTVWQAAALWGLNGASSGVMLAIGRGYVQRYCPNEILGRAAIASRTITRTAFVVGALVGGEVAERSGVRAMFTVAGLFQAAALVPMAIALRHDRDELATSRRCA